jgi:hypothetical protein
MANPSKRDIENENRRLREALEDLYDRVAELLGVDDDDADDEELSRKS